MGAKITDKLMLLVEDEPVLLDGIQAWLRDNEHGFALISARDGKKALELIDRYRPDVVVSDLRLPGMDGLELLLACRRQHPQMHFVVMSAFGTSELEELSRRYGAVRFLHKPVDLALLEQTITEVLSQHCDQSRAGYLSGISVIGFVQLLNLERQTLSLELHHPDARTGTLFLQSGDLVHAEIGDRSGLDAARELLAWEGAEIVIDRTPRAISRTIEDTLSHLILKMAHAKDEAGRSH
jgi:Response regulator containing CheY-like receiver domain and AraC-type DNA-binding domain